MWPSLLHHVSAPIDDDGIYSLYASPTALATERAALLEGARQAVNANIAAGLGSPEPLQCERSPARELVITLEAAIEHQMVPPLVALRKPCLLYSALAQLPRRAAELRRATSASASAPSPSSDPWFHLRGAAEAFTLARILGEKHLSSSRGIPADVAELYVGRLWLCLALARKSAAAWVALLPDAVPAAFSEHSLLAVVDERDLLVALLQPLCHVPFALPASAAAARGEAHEAEERYY